MPESCLWDQLRSDGIYVKDNAYHITSVFTDDSCARITCENDKICRFSICTAFTNAIKDFGGKQFFLCRT